MVWDKLMGGKVKNGGSLRMGGNCIITCCRGRFAPATTGRRITIREVAWREAPHNHADEPDFARPKLRFVRARRLSAAPLGV